MKKIFLSLAIFGFSLAITTDTAQAAQDISISIINISNENKDATIAGAKSGDVLRYETIISSATEDADELEVIFNVSKIFDISNKVDLGGGTIEGPALIYPKFSQTAPYEKILTFFARITPDCATKENIKFEVGRESATVPLLCEKESAAEPQTQTPETQIQNIQMPQAESKTTIHTSARTEEKSTDLTETGPEWEYFLFAVAGIAFLLLITNYKKNKTS